MNTPLIDAIIDREVEKALDAFIASFFGYDPATNMWVFPSPADSYGITAENMDKIKTVILDNI
jgi:hypothetical protein